MSGPSTYQPQNSVIAWIERRLPIFGLIHSSFIVYPVPRNLNYWWTFGGILAFMLGTYISLDGRNFGAGLLYWAVAREGPERRQVVAAIGPLWSWHEVWLVGFGGATQNTSSLSIADSGFSGWKTASMTFTASNVSQALSFLAQGSSPGAPPFLLLDGVSLTAAVPEPATWGMMLGGLGLVGLLARRRRARSV